MIDNQYKDLMNAMTKEVKTFIESFTDDPKLVSSWGHNYFCKEDGTALRYNPNNSKEHTCPLCKKSYESQLFTEVWQYIYRNEAAVTALKAAALYKVEPSSVYLDAILTISKFYITNYESFGLHNKEGNKYDSLENMAWGCGRIMPQSLNESIFFIRLFMALDLVKEHLPVDFLQYIKNDFASQFFALIKPQVDKIHNISCWLNNAIAVVGLFTGREDLVDFAFEGEFNNNRQLVEGVTEDGFWYEGSIHYNFFTLEGFMYSSLFTQRYNKTFREIKVLEKMLEAAFNYAFSNHILPNPNDGWPNINLKTYSYIYCIGTKIFGEESNIGKILRTILVAPGERGEIPLSKPYYFDNSISLERFLLIPDFKLDGKTLRNDNSINFSKSNFLILKNDSWNAFVKYGHHGPSHAHPDKMSIELTANNVLITRDLSNAGYGSTICNEWHRKTASHTTVMVDGQNHTSVEPGELLEFSNHNCTVLARDVFEDIDFTRSIHLDDKDLFDSFSCTSQSNHTYDYLFHTEGILNESSLDQYEWESSNLIFKDNGYEYYKEVKKLVTTTPKIKLTWSFGDLYLESFIELVDSEFYIALTPNNPVDSLRRSFIIRKHSANVEFNVNWRLV